MKVTYPGCAFDGKIDDIKTQLPDWYTKAAVSGFGNVKKQKTEVDPEIRNAREITAKHFKVPKDVIELVKKTWEARFVPSHVRVEPYKIHMYGPDGRFLPHRDTPEQGLVGTFLLGLGDTTSRSDKPNLRVADETFRADERAWVAFYPDVDHEVTTLKSGYRAVLAFKLFRDDDASIIPDDVETRSELGVSTEVNEDGKALEEAFGEARMPEAVEIIQEILEDIPLPVGLHFTHKYPRGMKEPNGFDAMLLQAAENLPHIDTRLLPVLIDEHVVLRMSTETYDNPDASSAVAEVFPLTDIHIDFLEGKITKAEVLNDETGAWVANHQTIPFYSVCSAPRYSSRDIKPGEMLQQQSDQVDWTGNEAREEDDHSIYMTYSIVLTANPVGKKVDKKQVAAAAKAQKGKKAAKQADTSTTEKSTKAKATAKTAKAKTTAKAVKAKTTAKSAKAKEPVKTTKKPAKTDEEKDTKKGKAKAKAEDKKPAKRAAATGAPAASTSTSKRAAAREEAPDAPAGRYSLRKRKADDIEEPPATKVKGGAKAKKARK